MQNLPDSQLQFESKTEPSVAKAQNYTGGRHRTEKMYTGRGGHRTYFVDESNKWGGDTAQHRKMGGGTPHILC